jgi:aspartate aminotransferase
MKELAQVASAVRASTTMEIDSLFKQMKAEGIDVVGFGAGEPDFATPENITQTAIDALNAHKTKYTPASGIGELKAAVCHRMKEDCGLDYEPSNVVIASGAKHVVYLALRALVDPGDEVILPAPYWVSYYELIKMMGGVPVVVHATEADDFKITAQQLRDAVTPKTKCMILNSPCNPTGMVYTREELQALADVCVEKDLYVLADEIYYSLLYDGREFVSLASLGDEIKARTILINGVSKSYAMTGWRIGYALADAKIIKVMSNYVSHSTASPATFSQWGAVEALTGPQDTRETMRQAFEERRNYIVERINAIPGVSCLKPEGAFYIMMNLKELIGKELYGVKINNADDFANLFLQKGLVATVPCTGFDAPEFVRWSYATSLDNIKEGCDRLEKFLANA